MLYEVITGAKRNHQFEGPGDPENDADPVTVVGAVRAVAGILERLPGGH